MRLVVHAVAFEFGIEGMQNKATEASKDTTKPESRQAIDQRREPSASPSTKESAAPKMGNAPTTGSAPKADAAPKTGSVLKPTSASKTAGAPKATSTSNAGNAPKAGSVSQENNTSRSTSASKTGSAPKSASGSNAGSAPKAGDTPNADNAPKAGNASKAAGTPNAGGTPKSGNKKTPNKKVKRKDAPSQQMANQSPKRGKRPAAAGSTSLARRQNGPTNLAKRKKNGSTSLAKRPNNDSTALAKRTRRPASAKGRPASATKAAPSEATTGATQTESAKIAATRATAGEPTKKRKRAPESTAVPANVARPKVSKGSGKGKAAATKASRPNTTKVAGENGTKKIKSVPKNAETTVTQPNGPKAAQSKTATKKAAATSAASAGAKKQKAAKKAATQNGKTVNGQKPAGTKAAAAAAKPAGSKLKVAATTAKTKGKPKAAHIKEQEKRTPFEVVQHAFTSARDWVVNNAKSPKFIVPVVIVVLYIGVSVFFSMHYLPGTVINEVDASWSTAKKVASKVQEAHTNYGLKVTGDGINLDISSGDIDFSLDPQAYEEGAKKDLPGWTWPVAAFLPRTFSVTEGVLFNQDKLQSTTDATVDAYNKNATMPQDASITYDSSKKTFVAKEEKNGNAISHDLANQTVTQAVKELKNEVTFGEEQIQKPNITMSSNTIDGAIKQANALGDLEIPLMVKESKAATIDSELIRSWLSLDKDGNVVANADWVADWAINTLAKKVNTVGTQRTYTRASDGKRVQVFGGTYGWEIDPQALTVKVCEQLAAGSSEPLEIPMKSTAEKYIHNAQDWGPRYVDVDLTEQYVIMFDEDSNIIMQSECVSGNTALNDETVTGVFYLEKKKSPEKLIGLDQDGDGLPDYESDVQYWMPFYGGYGLHDALWRNYFGENIYQFDGSHGCVNLPYYAAEILYNAIKVGDVVVVHD